VGYNYPIMISTKIFILPPLSIHHKCSICSPSIDLYLFLHNSSSPSLLFDTDLTPIPTFNHFFLNLLNFLFVFFLDCLFCTQVKFEKRWNKEFRNFSLGISYYIQQRQWFFLIEEWIFFNWTLRMKMTAPLK